MKRPWMPFYVNDFQMDTLDLTTEQVGAYMLLLMLAWKREGDIPADMKWLKAVFKRLTSDMHGNKFNALIPPILERYFVLGPDLKYRNKRMSMELEKAAIFARNQSDNAKKRWSNVKDIKALREPGQCLSQSHIESLRRLSVIRRKGE